MLDDHHVFEVLHDVPNTNVRLTVTPSRATLKFVPGLCASDKFRLIEFAGQVVGTMHARGVNKTWRGKIKLRNNDRLTVGMYQGDNRSNWQHFKETK